MNQGLVERRLGHGWRIEHHLTPAGEKMLRAGHRVADEVLAECFAPLSESERTALLALLRRLTEEPEDD